MMFFFFYLGNFRILGNFMEFREMCLRILGNFVNFN